jgi:hypothetical protein
VSAGRAVTARSAYPVVCHHRSDTAWALDRQRGDRGEASHHRLHTTDCTTRVKPKPPAWVALCPAACSSSSTFSASSSGSSAHPSIATSSHRSCDGNPSGGSEGSSPCVSSPPSACAGGVSPVVPLCGCASPSPPRGSSRTDTKCGEAPSAVRHLSTRMAMVRPVPPRLVTARVLGTPHQSLRTARASRGTQPHMSLSGGREPSRCVVRTTINTSAE